MKLYYMNPNNYGEQWFVMAETSEQAHQFILNSIQKKLDEDLLRGPQYGIEGNLLESYYAETLRDIKEYKKYGYTLDEYKEGQVICSEIC